MGLRGPRVYLTEAVMDEAEEADEAVIRLLSVVARSTTDGVVDRDELLAIRVAGERAGAEVRDVVRAAEKAATADHVADNVKRGGVTTYVRRRADAVGLHVPEFGEPRDAA